MGLLLFLGGACIPVVLGAGIYYFRMMGAGDMKLWAVVGGFLGPQRAVYCMIASLFVGAVLSIFVLLKRRNLKIRLLYFCSYIQRQQNGVWEPYLNEKDQDLPYSLSVSSGYAYYHPDTDMDFKDIVRRSDTMLYREKRRKK